MIISHDQIFYILSTGINLLSAESCITQYWVKLYYMIQNHGPVWPADVCLADNIELMEINSLSEYWLIHDSALNIISWQQKRKILTYV